MAGRRWFRSVRLPSAILTEVHIRRIGFAVALSLRLVAPLAGEAQVGKIAHVGVLDFGRAPSQEEIAKELLPQALREIGWVEGQNLVLERRYAESPEQLRVFAAELVQRKVDVLVVPSPGLASIALRETKTIPIVVQSSGFDLVDAGFVASLARPGGNLTGSQVLSVALLGKRLELLKDLIPNVARVATLGEGVTNLDVDPTVRDSYNREAAVAARTLGITIHHFGMRHAEEFPAVFRHMVDKGDRGLLVYTTPFTYAHRRQIVELAAQHRIAVCYGGKGWVEAGGLMSYGPSGLAIVRRTAVYVDKILKGAWPGDLPIEQPTKFELVINLKTAKALGLTIPRLLILRADEVIE